MEELQLPYVDLGKIIMDFLKLPLVTEVVAANMCRALEWVCKAPTCVAVLALRVVMPWRSTC